MDYKVLSHRVLCKHNSNEWGCKQIAKILRASIFRLLPYMQAQFQAGIIEIWWTTTLWMPKPYS